MKTCAACFVEKTDESYSTIKATAKYPMYRRNVCRACARAKQRLKDKERAGCPERLEKRRAWWAENSSRLAVKAKASYDSDPTFKRKKLDSCKKYRAANIQKIREKEKVCEIRVARRKSRWKDPSSVEKLRVYYSNKRKNDPQYKLKQNIRKRVREALKGKCKPESPIKALGCTVAFLKARIESQFKPGMNWSNTDKWHIDHIIPLSRFDLTDVAQYNIACHYTNLQPLWAWENISKSNKIIGVLYESA